jgi:hypothetical protein
LGAVTKEHADKLLRPAVQQMKRYGPFLRPVCLFFFTMENDAAWYTWVAEPAESESGTLLLHHFDEPDCRQLNKRALNEIIERVDLWYDAVFSTQIANGPGGSNPGRTQTKS